jgi:hypothetical protein
MQLTSNDNITWLYVASLRYVVTMDQDRRFLKSLIDWKTSGVPTSLYTKLTKIKIDIWKYIYMQP